MSCNNCTQVQPISACMGSLQIGIIDPITPVFVFFRDLATGKTTYIEATSEPVSGVLYANMDYMTLLADHPYQMWLTTGTTALEDYLGFDLPSGFPVECVSFTPKIYADYTDSFNPIDPAIQTFMLP